MFRSSPTVSCITYYVPNRNNALALFLLIHEIKYEFQRVTKVVKYARPKILVLMLPMVATIKHTYYTSLVLLHSIYGGNSLHLQRTSCVFSTPHTIYSLTFPLTHPFTHPHTHSLLTHPPTHSFTHSLNNSLSHQPLYSVTSFRLWLIFALRRKTIFLVVMSWI